MNGTRSQLGGAWSQPGEPHSRGIADLYWPHNDSYSRRLVSPGARDRYKCRNARGKLGALLDLEGLLLSIAEPARVISAGCFNGISGMKKNGINNLTSRD